MPFFLLDLRLFLVGLSRPICNPLLSLSSALRFRDVEFFADPTAMLDTEALPSAFLPSNFLKALLIIFLNDSAEAAPNSCAAASKLTWNNVCSR